jgi:hypothetical protein
MRGYDPSTYVLGSILGLSIVVFWIFCIFSIFQSDNPMMVIKEFQTLISGSLALLAAIITVWAAAERQLKQHKQDILLSDFKRLDANLSLIKSLKAEIKSLLYLSDKLKIDTWLNDKIEECAQLMNNGQPEGTVKVGYSIRAKVDYFRIFNDNADKIGNIPAPTCEQLVGWYLISKGFLEDLHTISDMQEEKARHLHKFLCEVRNNIHTIRINGKTTYCEIADYCNSIQDEMDSIKQQFSDNSLLKLRNI